MLHTTIESRTGGGVACVPAIDAGALVVSATLVASAIDIVDVPMPRRGSGSVLHARLDDRREIRGQRLSQSRAQLVRRLNPDASRAARAGHRGIIHAVRFALAFEQAAEAGAVVRVFQAGDG